MTALAPNHPPSASEPERGWRDRAGAWRARAMTAAVLGAATGLLVALTMPRGPVTAAGALLVMGLATVVGALSGLMLRSRWAMLLAPGGYVVAFELAGNGTGPTVGGLHLDTTWGIFALVLGRGFHGVLALAPMLVAAALGAGYARRGEAHRHVAWLYARRVVTGAATVGLVLLAVQIARPASTPAIVDARGARVPGSIAELDKVRIGGVDQWIQVRAWSPDKPVLLYIPGGPGQSDLALSRVLLSDLARDFVVVTWDGRGIGKSYPSFDASALTTGRVVADAIELTNHLRRRFAERKIYLFGESGGSVIGLLAVQKHPELFHAWLGSGQMVDLRETDGRIYRDLLAYGRRTHDTGLVDKLHSFGAPPYPTPWANAYFLGYYDKLAGEYDPPATYTRRGEDAHVGFFGIGGSEYSLVEKVNALRGLMDTFFVLYPQWQSIDFRRSAARLDVPVYLFTGDHELAARRDLALEWFRGLEAPRKRLYKWPNAGHATAFEHFDAFRRILTQTVVPETYTRR
jgi:pimeloyl-ACP methyl ester carboxylesterase